MKDAEDFLQFVLCGPTINLMQIRNAVRGTRNINIHLSSWGVVFLKICKLYSFYTCGLMVYRFFTSFWVFKCFLSNMKMKKRDKTWD